MVATARIIAAIFPWVSPQRWSVYKAKKRRGAEIIEEQDGESERIEPRQSGFGELVAAIN
jgi:hypothetical protein